jgi:uncharacterized membrane protein YccC
MTEIATRNSPRFSLLALSSWSFALRTWIATIAALYAAFWLQLGNAYSAAVCVGILALPTRGQAYQKALYRTGGTVMGFLASLGIAGLFNGTRDLFILAFAAWMAVCGYVASFLDGNRAYGAVLSGFTAAIVAFANIDTPNSVFSVGVDRCAAILVGVVAVMVFNDLLGAPDAFPDLARRLEETHHRITTFVRRMPSTRNADLREVGDILKTIVSFRADIAVLPVEAISGRNRAAAARTAIAAMVGEVAAARVIGAVLDELDDKGNDLVDVMLRGLNQTVTDSGSCRSTHDLDTCNANSPLFVAARAAQALVDQSRRVLSSFDLMQAGSRAVRGPNLPLFRVREAAFRNALRLFLVVLIGSCVLSLSGWPSVSVVMVMLAAVAGISTTVASPEKFSKDALIAILLAVAISGITEFLILDGTDSFPILAMGLAPAIVGSGLLAASGNPRMAPLGTLLLVFNPLVLLLSNPQNYDPQIYLVVGSLDIISVILLFITTTVLLPTSDDRKRAWLLRSLRRDFRRALREELLPHEVDEVAFRDADREVQLNALRPADSTDGWCEGNDGQLWAKLTSAAWRVRFALRDLHQNPEVAEEGRIALAGADSISLRLLANRLLTQRNTASEDDFRQRSAAAAALAWMAILIERSPREIAALTKELGR